MTKKSSKENKRIIVLSRILERFEKSRTLLYLHSLLTDSENEKVKTRVKKWCNKNNLEVVTKSMFDD